MSGAECPECGDGHAVRNTETHTNTCAECGHVWAANVAYWRDELEAYLAMRDDVAVDVADVRGDHDEGVVRFDAPHLDAEERAQLINAMQLAGFAPTSSVHDETVVVDADGTRLRHSNTDERTDDGVEP